MIHKSHPDLIYLMCKLQQVSCAEAGGYYREASVERKKCACERSQAKADFKLLMNPCGLYKHTE